jgi:tetratricopeptide (TPR) repeat protein
MSTNKGKVSTPTSSPTAPHILKLEQFVRMFKDSVLDKQDIRYCFILGSGASITSGVPSGARLVDWWLTDMYRDAQPGAGEEKLRAWVEQELTGIPGFTWDNRASFYGHIYNRRFPDNASGQTWLRRLMENKHSSFGYTVLARILSLTQHNLVLTTNFDNLVQDALSALSCPNPFIAHSHDDARFLANHDRKPRILKLHGDIDRETYNAASLIADLHEDWRDPLRHLLGSYTPVFLGYGGCDPGFMRFLVKEFTASDARPRPIWAYRVDAEALKKTSSRVSDPPGRTNTAFCGEFMERQGAWWLPTPGFDELMLLLGHALGYPHGRKEILAAAQRGADAYQTSLTDALKAARGHDGNRWCAPLDEMTRQAELGLLGEIKLRRWSEWEEYINAAVSPKEEFNRCEEAIAELPDDPRPQARLAWALCHTNPSDPQVVAAFDAAKHKLAGKHAPDSPEALYVRNSLGNALEIQGKYAEAEAEHRAVLGIMERVVGPEHPNTLRSRNNLANALDAQGKLAEVEVEHRAVLAMMQRLLGPEHPDTLKSRNNLANALRSRGKHAEAEAEHRAVLVIRERALGPEHPDTLASRNNLANALQSQGKYPESEAEHRAVLAIRERVLGPEHPDTLNSRNNLANALYAQGKHAEAEAEYRAVLAIRERVLGSEHPDTLNSRNNFANALQLQDKYAEAEREYRAVLVMRERVLGPEHPDTLTSRNNLANVLQLQGKYAKAEAEYRAILAIRERVLGLEHPAVFQSCYNLAQCLKAQGKKSEALVFARQALAGFQKTLGEAHPDTKAARKLVEELE